MQGGPKAAGSCGMRATSSSPRIRFLALRDNTERPITITGGTNRPVGRDPYRIVKAADEVLEAPPPPPRTQALRDGKAGSRIATVLVL
jgi:UDP-N-acetylglucosamine 2-epimerase (non-hydrolysing)